MPLRIIKTRYIRNFEHREIRLRREERICAGTGEQILTLPGKCSKPLRGTGHLRNSKLTIRKET